MEAANLTFYLCIHWWRQIRQRKQLWHSSLW